jgi:hypothetical protein
MLRTDTPEMELNMHSKNIFIFGEQFTQRLLIFVPRNQPAQGIGGQY